MPITLLDGILLAIMLVSAVLAMIRGFSREVLSIVSWIAAAASAYYLYKNITPFVQEYLPDLASNDTVANIIAAAAVFLITLIVVSVITMKVADFIIDSRIGALDRTLGFVFGALRGMLLVTVALLFFNWLVPEDQPKWVAEAKSKPMLETIGDRIVALLPEDPQGTILDRLKPATNPEGESDSEKKI
jgi:membrane protein required for colicin V production